MTTTQTSATKVLASAPELRDYPDALRCHIERYYLKRHGVVTKVTVAHNLLDQPIFRAVTFSDGAQILFCQGLWDPNSEWLRHEEFWFQRSVIVKGTPATELRAAMRSSSGKLIEHLERDHGLDYRAVGVREYREAMPAGQQHREAHGLNPSGTRLVPGHAIDAQGCLVHTDES